MKRGEIYFANLNSTIGSEINKKRPVIIISNDMNNKAAKTLTVIPLTSNITLVHPFEVFLSKLQSGLSKDSKATCQQIRTISKLRISGPVVGKLNKSSLLAIEHAILLHLGIVIS